MLAYSGYIVCLIFYGAVIASWVQFFVESVFFRRYLVNARVFLAEWCSHDFDEENEYPSETERFAEVIAIVTEYFMNEHPEIKAFPKFRFLHNKDACSLLGIKASSVMFYLSGWHEMRNRTVYLTVSEHTEHVSTWDLAETVAHELVHYWQTARGDLVETKDYVAYEWKGEHFTKFQDLAYRKRPWEIEAMAEQTRWVEEAVDRWEKLYGPLPEEYHVVN